MEKNMVLETSITGNKIAADTAKYIINKVNAPMRAICRYYSHVLEKNVSIRQGWLLTEAQTAFFATVLPANISLCVRLLLLTWFVAALKRCRRSGL